MLIQLSDIYSADYRATHPETMKYAAENTIPHPLNNIQYADGISSCTHVKRHKKFQHCPGQVVPDMPEAREEALTRARAQITEIRARTETAVAAAAASATIDPEAEPEASTHAGLLARAVQRQRTRWREALDMLADR